MPKVRHLMLCSGLASAMLAISVPAAALAQANGGNPATASCTGPVFSNIKLQNVSALTYVAQSTVKNSTQAVLFSATNQTWDGYRDSAGHLIIYKCGTNDVLTDAIGSKCKLNFKDCVSVEAYNNFSDQWWTRIVSDNGKIWTLQTLDASGDSKVMNDPYASKTSGTPVVMSTYTSTLQNEQFYW
jgi:hypothetical protein